MDGQLQASESVFGSPFVPLSKADQSYTYEIDGDELTLIYNNESMVVIEEGEEHSSIFTRTAKWLKQ